jgi:hypothetical protein
MQDLPIITDLLEARQLRNELSCYTEDYRRGFDDALSLVACRISADTGSPEWATMHSFINQEIPA